MQLSSCLRPLAAVLVPCLLAFPASGVAQIRTEEANLIGYVALATSTVTDLPSAIRGDLIRATDGNIYAVGSTGGNGRGSIARIAPDGTLTVLHAMATNEEGYSAFSGVIQASDGNLYGTTYLGGDKGGGVVYKVTLDGTYTVLRNLGQDKQDAVLPYAGLVQAPDGNLYGSTLRGGTNDKGTVFRHLDRGRFLHPAQLQRPGWREPGRCARSWAPTARCTAPRCRAAAAIAARCTRSPPAAR